MQTEFIVEALNYLGIVTFAVSGALKAGEKNMDLLGFITLGFSTALVGGIIRDLLLGRTPPVNLTYLPYPLTAIVASVITFTLYSKVHKHKDVFLYPDAFGLGAFAAIGADVTLMKCYILDIESCWLLVIMLSSLTAVGGGIVRDILAGEIPLVLRREIYATATAIGGFIHLISLPFGREIAMLVTIFVVTTLRLIALKRGWELPKAR